MHRLISAVPLLLAAGLAGCSGPRPPSQGELQACRESQKVLDAAEDKFIARVKELRREKIRMVDYDREMVAALTAYRDRIRAILDDDAANVGRCHCAGEPLTDLKRDTGPRLVRVQHYLGTFQRALREDPPDAYVP